MAGFSPKVTASTVAAGVASVVGGIVGPYVFPNGTPADVKGLWLGVVSAGVAFGAGYITKHPAVAKEAEKVVSLADEVGKPFSQIAEYVEAHEPTPQSAPVVQPIPAVPLIQPPAQPTVAQ